MVDEVTSESAGDSDLTIRAVGADRGWGWIADGFDYFKRAPGVWVAIALILGLITLVLVWVPLVGPLAVSLLMPVFMGGLMLLCRGQDEGKEPEIADLFAGFKTRTNQLLVVGALYAVAMLVIGVIAGGIGMAAGGSVMMGGMMTGAPDMGAAAMGFGAGMLLASLVTLALSVPVVMAVWFAPALVVLKQLEPVDALKRSFAGCLKNIVPFLVWGVIALVISVVAAIPMMLGWLVAGPVLIGSAYVGYRDIYG